MTISTACNGSTFMNIAASGFKACFVKNLPIPYADTVACFRIGACTSTSAKLYCPFEDDSKVGLLTLIFTPSSLSSITNQAQELIKFAM